MSISVTSFTKPFFPSPIHALLTFRSMVYASVCFVAVLVLAYLTKPSDSSFRAYLTEQTIRRHITHLDDPSDEEPDLSGVQYSSRHNTTNCSNAGSDRSQIHFVNRASVILRTPSHAYRNLVFFTIAFIVPPVESDTKLPDPDFTLSNGWFIGAFGGWWRGGPLYSWWVDAVTRSKDEEGVSSGVLNIKTLDNLNEYDGISVLPFSSFEAKKNRASPPRLRNPRNELSECVRRVQNVPPPRSTTPPPLPATASLPFHNVQQSNVPVPQPFHPPALSSVATSSSPPKSLDQSPVVVELLSRISSTKTGVQDLRSQIADFRAQSSKQRETLNRELEAHRERKRQEELTRGDLKTRTKSLEDSKRSAETAKRDAERKLKSAETRRDEVARKITHLRNEITKWRSKLGDDCEWVENTRSGAGGCHNHEMEEGVQLEEEMQKRKAEIKVAENVISALTARTKELEDKVMDGRERLKVVLERACQTRVSQQSEFDHGLASPTDPSKGTSDPEDDLPWPPAQTSPLAIHASVQPPVSRFPVSDDQIRPLPPANFAPFDDPTSFVATDGDMLQSAFLIPSGLINSFPDATPDMDPFRSFERDDDPFIIKPNRPATAWQKGSGAEAHETTNATVSMFADDSSFKRAVSNGYGSGGIDSDLRPRFREGSNLDQQRATLRTTVPDQHSVLDPFSSAPNLIDPSRDLEVTPAPRRWFSVKEKKLNPEAEAFNLPSTKSFFKPTVPAFFDALNPSKSGLISHMESDGTSRNPTVTHSSFFSKAFAPSPAERAALGAGRFHTSLEKLPSLSDVPGSLHTSPVLSHATPPNNQVNVVPGSSFARSMAWLNSLPRRKPKFSPWDDEEH